MDRTLTRDQLHVMLRRRFGEADAERLGPWVLPAIGFHDGELGREPTAIGMTRFGGRPDLPAGAAWPIGPNGPLAFIGQVSLAEVARWDVDRVLPTTGSLAFFHNIADYAWGRGPEDREKFAVIFVSGDADVRRREFPDGIHRANRVVPVRQVSPYVKWEVPRADPLAREILGIGESPTVAEPAPDAFTAKYWTLDWDLTHLHIPIGRRQMLGWANGIYQQSEDCRLLCSVARHGFSGTVAAAVTDRQHWRCLLQVSDDAELYGDDWGGGGTIAYMIHDDDLRAGEFGRCWCVLSTS